jgi:hypothetical protein
MSGRIGDRTPTAARSKPIKGKRALAHVASFSPSGSGLMPLVPSRMEDSMCREIDYRFFAAQKKAQETRIKQEQRAGVIHQLLNEANMQGDKTNVEGTPVEEVAPAK